MTKSNSHREFAVIEVVPEYLAQLVNTMPRLVQIVGSLASEHSVRLVLDVTETDLPGGKWNATVHESAAEMRVTLGPAQ